MHKNACAQKKSHCRGTGSEAVEKPRGKRERAEALLRFARLFCQSFRHGLCRVTSRSLRRGLRRATVPQFNMVASLRAQSALAMFPVSLGSSYRPALRWPGIPGLRSASRCPRPSTPSGLRRLRPVSATGGGLRAPLFPSGKRRLLAGQLLTIVPPTKRLPFRKKGAGGASRLRDCLHPLSAKLTEGCLAHCAPSPRN